MTGKWIKEQLKKCGWEGFSEKECESLIPLLLVAQQPSEPSTIPVVDIDDLFDKMISQEDFTRGDILKFAREYARQMSSPSDDITELEIANRKISLLKAALKYQCDKHPSDQKEITGYFKVSVKDRLPEVNEEYTMLACKWGGKREGYPTYELRAKLNEDGKYDYLNNYGWQKDFNNNADFHEITHWLEEKTITTPSDTNGKVKEGLRKLLSDTWDTAEKKSSMPGEDNKQLY